MPLGLQALYKEQIGAREGEVQERETLLAVGRVSAVTGGGTAKARTGRQFPPVTEIAAFTARNQAGLNLSVIFFS